VQLRHLPVQDFWEHVHLASGVLARVAVAPELGLRQGLVREGAGHDQRGVAGGASKAEKPPLGEDDDLVAYYYRKGAFNSLQHALVLRSR